MCGRDKRSENEKQRDGKKAALNSEWCIKKIP